MYQIDTLITALENHAVKFQNEKSFADRMITFLRENQERAFHNYHWDDGHITASMLITNPSRTKVLLMLHKKIKKWLQFGGHSGDSPEVLATAIREFHEESGILVEPDIFSYESGLPVPIFDLDIHKIPADLKGRPGHIHYDIRFLGIVPDDIPLNMQTEEVDDIGWFNIDGIEIMLKEDGLVRMIQKIKNSKHA